MIDDPTLFDTWREFQKTFGESWSGKALDVKTLADGLRTHIRTEREFYQQFLRDYRDATACRSVDLSKIEKASLEQGLQEVCGIVQQIQSLHGANLPKTDGEWKRALDSVFESLYGFLQLYSAYDKFKDPIHDMSTNLAHLVVEFLRFRLGQVQYSAPDEVQRERYAVYANMVRDLEHGTLFPRLKDSLRWMRDHRPNQTYLVQYLRTLPILLKGFVLL